MKDSIRRKLEKLDERFEEISRLLSDAGVISRQNQFRELSMEYSKLGPLVDRYRRFIGFEGDLAIALEMAADKDIATKDLGEQEVADLAPRIAAEELELQRLLGLLLFPLAGEEPRLEQRERARAVLVLRALVLALDHDAGR